MAFWDASALLPLCARRPQTAVVRRLAAGDERMTAWWGTPVELYSVLARLLREGALTADSHRDSVRRLEALRRTWDEVAPTEQLRGLAESIPERYNLRAQDAFQLASALVWCDEKPRQRQFICLDRRLGESASRLGFAVIGGRP